LSGKGPDCFRRGNKDARFFMGGGAMNPLKIWIVSAAFALLSGAGLLAQMTDTRAVIDRTQRDLRRAQEFERSHGKEVSRYDNAQKHLSEFDRDYTRGHFDKGKLDTAIDDLKNVVDHNTLSPEDRDGLGADLRELRLLRAEHDRG
jgi:hypothetical protein